MCGDCSPGWRQLTELRTSQTNQRRLVDDKTVLGSINEVVALVNWQIRSMEGEIASLIDQDPLWKELDDAFRTIKGAADRTVAGLMAHMPEIGTLSNKAIAKLAGLAPVAGAATSVTSCSSSLKSCGVMSRISKTATKSCWMPGSRKRLSVSLSLASSSFV